MERTAQGGHATDDEDQVEVCGPAALDRPPTEGCDPMRRVLVVTATARRAGATMLPGDAATG